MTADLAFSISAGLAASTKYNGGVVAVAVVAAHGLHWGRQALLRLGRLIGAGLAAGFTTIGVTGTGSFLAGAGGAAIITSSASRIASTMVRRGTG